MEVLKVKNSNSSRNNLQYAIYTILNGEYTKFEEPEYSEKTTPRRYDAPFEILEKLRCA
jgi:hypothetical protein